MKTTLFHAVAALLLLSSCSYMGPQTQTVRVWADSPTADILVNGEPVGTGKAVVTLPTHRKATFTGREGTARTDVVLHPQLSYYGVADLCGGWLLFPLCGLSSAGAWELPQDVVPLHIPRYKHP